MVNNCRKYLTLFYVHMIFYCCHLLEAVCVSVYNILFLLIMVRRTTYVIFLDQWRFYLCACCMHVVCPHGLDVVLCFPFLFLCVVGATVEVSLQYLFSFKAVLIFVWLRKSTHSMHAILTVLILINEANEGPV